MTASEAASYVFCAKAWHLEHVLGLRPSAAATEWRAAGVVGHGKHGAQVAALQRVGPWLVRAVVALLVVAAVLLVLAVLTLTAGR